MQDRELAYEKMLPDEHDAVRAMIHSFYESDPNMGLITDEKIEKTFNEFSTHPERGVVYVLKRAGKIVGYSILVTFWSNEAGGTILDIDELFVEEQERGKGIATDFIKYVIENRIGDCVAVELGVIAGNERAQKLYERIGFRLSTNKRLLYEFPSV
jgi:GNAT superfamily N-acetyltransferase